MAVHRLCSLARLVPLGCLITVLASASEPDFNHDVRPILSQFCFKCHGMDG